MRRTASNLSVAIVALMVCIGCNAASKGLVKPDQAKIDAYVESNPGLAELDKACIYDGRFEIGMRKETVMFLLGEPKMQEVVQQPWGAQDKWTYRVGRETKTFYMEDNGVVGIEEN